MAKESIVDASVPSAGRIYDYLLGGYHNFEVDRQAAEQIRSLLPFIPSAVRLQRWCLRDIAHELTTERGFDTIIDFASGLPTQDHIHTAVPAGTTVVYSDYDPVVVEYAREILDGTQNVYFFEADARKPEQLLNSPELAQIIGTKRNVAFVAWGIGTFLRDEELAHMSRVLYEWSGDKSCWAFNAQGGDVPASHPSIVQTRQIYEKMGTPVYLRSKREYLELISPWIPDGAGFVSLLEWHGLDQSEMTEKDREMMGPTSIGYGTYLIK